MTSGSDISSFDPSRPSADAQIAGLLFALVLVDQNTLIAEANHAAENMLGCSAKRLLGKPLLDIIGPLDPRVEARFTEADAALVARDVKVNARRGRGPRQSYDLSARQFPRMARGYIVSGGA